MVVRRILTEPNPPLLTLFELEYLNHHRGAHRASGTVHGDPNPEVGPKLLRGYGALGIEVEISVG